MTKERAAIVAYLRAKADEAEASNLGRLTAIVLRDAADAIERSLGREFQDTPRQPVEDELYGDADLEYRDGLRGTKKHIGAS